MSSKLSGALRAASASAGQTDILVGRVLHVSAGQLLGSEKIAVHRAQTQIKLTRRHGKFAMAKEVRFFCKSKSAS